ncbi:hypothetical protein C0J52_16187 [Blattella germanica]|nr:hypothetical protein C0J52_16187 [Blattella germanica]
MKLPIIFLAVLGLTFGKSIPTHSTKNLQDDLNDFLALVPVDDILAIALDYLANDAQVQELMVYVQSEEFHTIILTVEALPEFDNFVNFLNDLGLDVTGYINTIHNVIGLPPFPTSRKHMRRGVGVDGLIDDVIAILPVDDLKALFEEKLVSSPDFKAFYDAIGSPEFQSIIQTLNAMPEYQALLDKLRDYGVDVDHYIELIRALFGLTKKSPVSTRNLQDDLNDFLALVPVDQVVAIALDYLANDAQVQELVAYVQTEEFHSIILTVEALPEFSNFVSFLNDLGLDVTGYINSIHNVIGLPPYPATPVSTRNLQDDLNDFLALVPVDQVVAIALDYLANDAQVQELVAYVQTEEFHSIILTVEALPEFSNFVSFLNDLGLDVTGYINSIHNVIGLPPYPASRKHLRRGVGVDGLIDDIIAILPVDDLKALFEEKLVSSPDFKAFYDAIGSPEFQSIIQTLNALPEYQALLDKLRDYGVDVDHYIELIRALFGLTKKSAVGTKNLQDDLNDLLALLPVDQILSIALDYLANDAQVQEVMVYLQGDEFQSIVLTIEALPEFGNFLNFVKEHGLDVVQYINILHDLLGIPPYNPVRRSVRRGVGINGLIEDIVAVIPIDQLLALYQDKLQTSADFQALYEEIHSAEFLTIIDTLKGLQAYQDLLQKLRDYGVDVDYYIDLIKQLLGFSKRRSIGTKNLQDDLNDLLALLPVDQILSIALDYLANDAQVQEAMVYLQGDEFQSIVLTIEALPEFGNFLNFVKEHGLDVVQYINILHDLLGIPPYNPVRRSVRRGVGINGLIEDIVAVIPIDQLLALFQDKLQNSADFQALYEEIHSAEFLTIIDTLKGLQAYQDLLQKLRDYGVDVDYYIDLIKQLLGFSKRRSTKNLQDDLNDLIALLPIDQILSIALDYLANDAQVQEVMVYLQGDEFQSIVLTIEALPEFGNFLNFVKEHGLDVVQYINVLHDLLGIPPYNPARRSVRRGVGINGLIEDIVAVVPVDQLLALFQDKLQNSADFQALYEEIHSAEFLTIIDTLKGLQEYQDLLQKLRDYGVDVDYYIDLIKQLLGFTKY